MSRRERGNLPLKAKGVDDLLLKVLIEESRRRGDSYKALANHLGVTYERLYQWTRGDGSLRTARRQVHECAARYLGVPQVAVLAMSGALTAEHFISPRSPTLEASVRMEVEAMRRDPWTAGFVPESVNSAPRELQAFILLLYRTLRSTKEAIPPWAADLERLV